MSNTSLNSLARPSESKIIQNQSTTNNTYNSVSRGSPNRKEPSRLEILRMAKGKTFAGETDDLTEEFKIKNGILNYTGHLPGLQTTISTRYANLSKMSAAYMEQKGQPGWGGPRVPFNDSQHDKWGSLKPLPEQLKRDIANLYLQTAHPNEPIDTSYGIGRSPSRLRDATPSELTAKCFPNSNNKVADTSTSAEGHVSVSPIRTSATPIPSLASPTRHSNVPSASASPSRLGSSMGAEGYGYGGSVPRAGAGSRLSTTSVHGRGSALLGGASSSAVGLEGPIVPCVRVPVETPAHVAGYKGHMAGTRHLYGENFNRVDYRASATTAQYGPGGKGVTAAAATVSPPRVFGPYEANNLIVGNLNSIPH